MSTGLGAPGETDLLQLVQNARAMAAPTGPIERARATAYHFLLTRAVAAIGGLPRHGAKAGDVDAIETDLRWAARLKAELIRTQFPLVLRTIESTTGKPPEEMRASDLVHLLHDCIAALAQAVDDFHPHKGGRLAAPAGLALTRVITRFHRAQTSLPLRARATPRLSPGVTIPDWTRRVAPWQSVRGSIWLETPPRVRAGLAGLGEPHRALLIHRCGWGERPKTVQEAAGMIGTTPIKAAQMERRAVREAAQLALRHGHSKS